MRDLPPDERARVEVVLATTDLKISAAEPPPLGQNSEGEWMPLGPTVTEQVRSLALTALGEIITIVNALDRPAADRREAVESYRDRLIREYQIHREPFLALVRADPRWQQFQKTLRNPEQTDTPPTDRHQHESATLGEWLRRQRLAKRLTIARLAATLNEDASRIGRHERNEERPGSDWQQIYETFYGVGIPNRFLLDPPQKRRRNRTKTARKRSR